MSAVAPAPVQSPEEMVARLAQGRVMVVGDVMLDRYVMGKVSRISPEAPIPVLEVREQRDMLGGAGNVVANLAALKGAAVLAAVIGQDADGNVLHHLLEKLPQCRSACLALGNRPTTVKTRFVADRQQILRTDSESTATLNDTEQQRILANIDDNAGAVTAFILSDYAKGVLTPTLCQAVIALAGDRPVIVDPKGQDWTKYHGASWVTPNRKELGEASQMPTASDDDIEAAARALIRRYDLKGIIATRSEQGISIIPAHSAAIHIPTRAQSVFDVTGAGDTVVATIALGLAAGLEVVTSVKLANEAAGIVVAKSGVANCSPAELLHALHEHDIARVEAKIFDRPDIFEQAAAWRAQGLRVGFTNGCFDLLHPGHVSLLRQSRAACDKLIVGLNADSSVRKLKGDSRPVQDETARAIVLASLGVVDAVTLFAEETPINLIEGIKPDVLVKGADYTIATVVGAEFVHAHGGRVMLANLEEGFSTTRTIKRLLNKEDAA